VPDEPANSKLRQSASSEHKAKERADQNRYLRKELERLRNERDRAKQASKRPTSRCAKKEARPTHLKAHRLWLTLTLLHAPHLAFAPSRACCCAGRLAGHRQGSVSPNRHHWVMRLSIVRMQSVKLLQGRGQAPEPPLPTADLDDLTQITPRPGQAAQCARPRCPPLPAAGWPRASTRTLYRGRGIAFLDSERWQSCLNAVIAVVGRPRLPQRWRQ